MSEQIYQEALQTILRAMDEFANADVVINDWAILDASGTRAPYIIIENSDSFNIQQPTVTALEGWDMVINLIYYLADTSWQTGMNGFRDTRQAILDKFNEPGNARSFGGLEGVHIPIIRSETPITYMYSPGVDPEFEPDALPIFAAQAMIFEVEEF